MPCSTCDVRACVKGGAYPETCTANLCAPGKLDEILDLYTAPQYHDVMRVALDTYHEAVANKWARVQEVVFFAREMGFTRIGIASCLSYAHEAGMLAEALRAEGFEVVDAMCKMGGLRQSSIGLRKDETKPDGALCNPVMQADALNHAETDMNLVVGLCLGHDMLFNRHALALTTTLAVKDQSLGGPKFFRQALESWHLTTS